MNFSKLIVFVFLGSFLTALNSCSSSKSGSLGHYSSVHKRSTKKSNTKERRSARVAAYSKSNGSKNSEDMIRDEIVLSAMKYTGRDYKPGGKSPDTGFDCSGFTSYIFSQNGIPLSGPSHKQATLGKQKSKSSLLPGDLVFFGNEDRISHVAIVASNKKEHLEIVHATTSAGVQIDNITDSEYWTDRYLFGVDIVSKR